MFVLATDSTVRFLVAIIMVAASLAPRPSVPHVARGRSRLSRDHAMNVPHDSSSSLVSVALTSGLALPAELRALRTEPIALCQAYDEAIWDAEAPRFIRLPFEDPLHATPRLLRLRF